ncbi:MAG: MMPL family transporter, partial [Actinomycetes bacterium]
VVDDPSSVAIAKNLTDELEAVSGVKKVTSYYSLGNPASLRSTDSHATYFFINFDTKAQPGPIATELQDKFSEFYHGAKLYVAGWQPTSAAINQRISSDLGFAESIAVPLTVLLLTFVFGSLVAAGLPLLVAGISILGTFTVLWVASQLGDTSIFGVNLATGMGLGLGIDYALLIVNRFREERAAGVAVPDAVRNTVLTAGRTVFFSGLTVAVVLLSLWFFPQYFLKTFAVAGVSAVVLAVIGALVALPALLNLLGDNVNRLKVIRGDLKPKDHGLWYQLSRFVMRRPLQVMAVVLVGLAGVMSLSNGVAFGLVDDRVLPKSDPVSISSNVIRDRFDGREGRRAPQRRRRRKPDRELVVGDLAVALIAQRLGGFERRVFSAHDDNRSAACRRGRALAHVHPAADDRDAGQALPGIIEEARLYANKPVTVTAPPDHFDTYNSYGLRAALRGVVEVRRAGDPVKGREVLRTLLRTETMGTPRLLLGPDATWARRAFFGGYARVVGEDRPADNLYT